LPELILNIGLITSFDSAAYHDFISELKRSGYGFKVFLINSIMQGKNTERSIISALKSLEQLGGIDVIVITRGGGSIAELSCFDSEKIATCMANLSIPVLSGIGHEINTTVTDLAAHTFAKTPTAIAKVLVECLLDFVESIDLRQEKIIDALDQTFTSQRRRLKDNAIALQSQTLGLIKNHHQRLAEIREALKRSQAVNLKDSRKLLTDTYDSLKKIIYLHVQNSRTKISQYQQLTQMADPANILKRGFSITRSQEGKIIRSIKDIKNIKVINSQLADGIINSTIVNLPQEEQGQES